MYWVSNEIEMVPFQAVFLEILYSPIRHDTPSAQSFSLAFKENRGNKFWYLDVQSSALFLCGFSLE